MSASRGDGGMASARDDMLVTMIEDKALRVPHLTGVPRRAGAQRYPTIVRRGPAASDRTISATASTGTRAAG